MSLPKSNLEWKFTQVFGDKSLIENVNEEDIVTSMSFSRDGKFLAIGDIAGRVVMFEHKSSEKSNKRINELNYKTEFQSHFKDFDCLKSVDIEPKINIIEFLPPENDNQFLLSANDKTIKLWKLNDKVVKKSEKLSKKTNWTKANLAVPALKVVDSGFCPSIKKVYSNLHSYNINSLSACVNGEHFLSADDLTVNLWSLGVSDKSFTLLDISPKNINEISEVITTAKFDPFVDSTFACGTSKGVIKLCDLRANSKVTGPALHLEDEAAKASKNFFTELVSSISDLNYGRDSNFVISRTLLNANIWDRRAPKAPLLVTSLYEPLKSKLCALYEKELIFDKFDIKMGHDASYFVTGMYNNTFHVVDMNGEKNTQFELNFKKKTISKQIKTSHHEQIPSDFDITKRVLKTACHPVHDFIVVASFNCLFVYNSV